MMSRFTNGIKGVLYVVAFILILGVCGGYEESTITFAEAIAYILIVVAITKLIVNTATKMQAYIWRNITRNEMKTLFNGREVI